MLYNLIEQRRGKEKVVMIDELSKVNHRKRNLENCQRKGIRNQRIVYVVQPSQTNVKFKQRSHNCNKGGKEQLPKRVI